MRDIITSNPKILGGKPTIRGTRITVEFVLELLASGLAPEDVVKEYPHLTIRDVRAALQYAARAMKREEVITAPVYAPLRR